MKFIVLKKKIYSGFVFLVSIFKHLTVTIKQMNTYFGTTENLIRCITLGHVTKNV